MPARLGWFLLALGLMLGVTLGVPLAERSAQMNQSRHTSLSYAPQGYKGLYLLLRTLKAQPVALWQHSMMLMKPPHAAPQDAKTLWLIEPGPGLFFDGQAYGLHMQALVWEGHHLVFVLDTRRTENDVDIFRVLRHLRQWYGVNLKVVEKPLPDTLSVTGHFPSRAVQTLNYRVSEDALPAKSRAFRWWQATASRRPALAVFRRDSVQGGNVLLETATGDPLIVRYPLNRGSLTVALNSFYFENNQLPLGDNAALAMALSEINRAGADWFEVYSLGFNENRDLVTYLATGPGVALLVSIVLLLVAFCAWLICQPVSRKRFAPRAPERQFTQEAFIDALAGHYLETRDWDTLYQKLVDQFRREIDLKYPGLALDAQLERLARNRFFNVPVDELRSVLTLAHIGTARAFIARCARLAEIQQALRKAVSHPSNALPSPQPSQKGDTHEQSSPLPAERSSAASSPH